MTHRQILTTALARMRKGAQAHERFRPTTDKRDLYTEMQEELYDVMNYAAMQIQKLEAMKKKRNGPIKVEFYRRSSGSLTSSGRYGL